MNPFVRRVPTASGATAVQIVDKTGGRYRIVEHLGSAYTPEQLAALVAAGKAKLADPWQLPLEFDVEDKPRAAGAVVKSSRSGILIDTIRAVYDRLGFDVDRPGSGGGFDLTERIGTCPHRVSTLQKSVTVLCVWSTRSWPANPHWL